MEESTYPWINYWLRLAGNTLARHKEEFIFSFITALGVPVFDNAVATRTTGYAGRGSAGSPSGLGVSINSSAEAPGLSFVCRPLPPSHSAAANPPPATRQLPLAEPLARREATGQSGPTPSLTRIRRFSGATGVPAAFGARGG